MDFNKQIKWIENKIEQLTKLKEGELDTQGPTSYDEDINALKSILKSYKYAQERSIELSWIKSPDRMGQ